MKKTILSLLLLCIGVSHVSAQRLEGGSDFLRLFLEKHKAFKLTAYGAYSNGKELNRFYPSGNNSHEGIVFMDDKFYHWRTLDGTFRYEAKVNDQFLNLSKKQIFNHQQEDFITVDKNYSSWIKLVWVESKDDTFILFTVDKEGTYRYFKLVDSLKDL